jgi:hypothetical protein
MGPRGESGPKAKAMSALSVRWLSLTVKNVVTPLIDDDQTEFLLREDGVAGNDHSFQRQRFEQLQSRRDLVGPRVDPQLPNHTGKLFAKGRQEMHPRIVATCAAP